jgi:hypothetical protein
MCNEPKPESKHRTGRMVNESPLNSDEHKLVVINPSGDLVCGVSCSSSTSIPQLKTKIAAASGLQTDTMALYLPEADDFLRDDESLRSCGMPSQMYAFALSKKINIAADIVRVPARDLIDVRLRQACAGDAKDGDIIDLRGCVRLRDVRCLHILEHLQELDMSGCINVATDKLAEAVALLAHG